MIKKSLLLKIFNAACMQRWNDKLRPIELTEMDKQAHKMMIAYFLGKIEEDNGVSVDWIEIIEGGIYEYLLRSVLTDIKPPIFYKIMEKTQSYEKLRKWAYEEWRLMIENFEGKFQKTFLAYHSESHQNVNRKILSAAHILATKWEYGVLEKFNYQDYEKTEIEKRLKKEYEKYEDLHGIKILEAEKGGNELYDQEIEKHGPLTRLINLCGQLRFQLRWAHIHRIPKTSVLGHLLFVAIISYLISISIESKSGTEKYCRKGRFNNFFTGLFHDLPEVLTRDIVSPVKQSIEGLDEIIKKEEKEEMEQKIIMLFPDLVNSNWKNEMRLFTGILDSLEPNKTIEEFDNVYYIKGAYTNLKTDDIPTEYAADEYKPRDGRIVKDADKLAAFIEALVAIENGCSSRALYEAQHNIKPKYNKNERAEEKPNTQGAAFDVMREIYTEF